MSFSYDVNNVGGANGGAEIMYDLKALLVAQGWSVVASGGGTSSGLYSSSGDVISSVTIMNTSRAWFRIQDPGGTREFCIQRGSSGERYWWIKYSALDKFTGGTPDEDDMPTATDEQNVHGSSTTGESLFGVASSYKYHLGAEDAAPYPFYAFAATNGTGVVAGVFLFDYFEPGSYPSADADPVVVYANSSTSSFDASQLGNASAGPQGWYKMNLSGETWVVFTAQTYYSAGHGQLVPANAGTNPYDGDDNGSAIPYGRGPSASTQIGWKGTGTMMRWCHVTRSDMDTQSVSSVIVRVIQGDITLPWPDVTPVL